MILTLYMTPELEMHLRDKAAQEGLEPDRFVLHTLEERLRAAEMEVTHLSRTEPEQHPALIALSDQIEMDYARRLEHVLALARLRGISLEAQMQALGIPQFS